MEMIMNSEQTMILYYSFYMISQTKQNPIKSFDISQSQWLKQLAETGVVVIKQVLNPAEVTEATNLFWEWLQSLGTGIKRGQPQTWQEENWPGLKNIGFFCTYGGCHSKASWFIRCNQKVRQSFSKIWKSKELISSFDTFIAWKPWWMNRKQKPHVQNLHLDQNPYYKKGLKCVQGMVPLKRVRQNEVGGLMVVPNSHKEQAQSDILKRYPLVKNFQSDWVEFHDNDPYIVGKKGVLVQCQAGDLILWDSRIIHGGKICQPSTQFQEENKNQLVRLSMTVTMVPREWANQEVLELRQKAFKDKVGLTHWPHEFHKSGMGGFIKGLTTSQIKYEWPKLEGEVKKLV